MAVAALPAIAVGLAALLLAFAAIALYRPLIVSTLGQLPLVGGWVQGRIDALVLGAATAAVGWVDSAIGPLADLIRAASKAVTYWRFWVWQTIGALKDEAVITVTVRMPANLSAAYAYTTSALQAAYAYTTSALAAAYAYANEVLQSAYAYTTSALQAAYAYAGQVLQAAYAYTYSVGVQVQQLAYQLTQGEQARALAAEAALAQYTVAVAERDLAWTVEAVRSAEIYAQQLAGTAEGFARDLVDLEAGQRQAQVGALAAAAAAATAAMVARVGAIEDSPCQTYCSPLGDLGQLLQGLEEAGLLALVLALVAEARTHPDQVVSTVRDLYQGPVGAAWEGLGLAGRQP